jgi:hypothetical protein
MPALHFRRLLLYWNPVIRRMGGTLKFGHGTRWPTFSPPHPHAHTTPWASGAWLSETHHSHSATAQFPRSDRTPSLHDTPDPQNEARSNASGSSFDPDSSGTGRT